MSWAEVKKINSNLDTPLDELIGADADPASASGSVHGKLKELRSYLYGAIGQNTKPMSLQATSSFRNTSTTYQTALQLTGAGRLLFFGVHYANNSGSRGQGVKVTVDGHVVWEGDLYIINGYDLAVPNWMGILSPTDGGTKHRILYEKASEDFRYPIPALSFKSSLLIEQKKSGIASNAEKVVCLYEIE